LCIKSQEPICNLKLKKCGNVFFKLHNQVSCFSPLYPAITDTAYCAYRRAHISSRVHEIWTVYPEIKPDYCPWCEKCMPCLSA